MDNIYKLSIRVDYSNDESSSSTGTRDYSVTGMGHAWLELEEIDNNGEMVEHNTYGTWNFDPFGLSSEGGLYTNAEKDREWDFSRSTYITEEQANQLQEIVQEYEKKGDDAWGYLTPCSHFASETWEKVTNEKLDHDGIFISTPGELGDSIQEANGGIKHNDVCYLVEDKNIWDEIRQDDELNNNMSYPVNNNGNIWDEIRQEDELNHNMSYPVDNNGNIWDEIRQDDEFKHEIYEYEPPADLGDIGDIGDGGDAGDGGGDGGGD